MLQEFSLDTRHKRRRSGTGISPVAAISLEPLETRVVQSASPTAIPLTNVNGEPFAFQIQWGGRPWYVQETETTRVQPGNNLISRSNVFVDDLNRLHLKYSYLNGQWRGAGVMLQESLGYGDYQFALAGDVALARDMVFGAFPYDLSAPDPHREFDYEVGTFDNTADPYSTQFTIQPASVSANTKRFNPPTVGSGGVLTAQFHWQPHQLDGFVVAGARDPMGMTIADRVYHAEDVPSRTFVPTHGNEFFRFNVWNTHGGAPANGQTVEIIVAAFKYVPLAPTGVAATDGAYTDKTIVTWTAPQSAGAKSQSVYRGTSSDPNQATLLASNLAATATSFVDTTGAAGTTYNYFVRAFASDGGSPFSAGDTGFRAGQPAVANDSFVSRISLTGQSVSISGSNVGATREIGEPNPAGVSGGHSVWYIYTPTVSGKASITTLGSNFDTTLGVYRGTILSGLTKLADNDDANGTTSAVTIDVAAGQPVQIEVDGYSNSVGAFRLNVAVTRASVPPTSFLPVSPTNVTASDGTFADRVRVSFSSVVGATGGYTVYRASVNNSTAATQIGGTASTTFDDLTAVPGTLYTYFVTAQSPTGTSGFSAGDSGYRAATLTGSVGFSVRENYSTVFVADLTLTNTSGRAWTSWTLEFDLPASMNVTDTWNADFTRQGNHFVVRPRFWTAALAPGQSVTIGFVGVPGNYTSGFANARLVGIAS